MSSCDDADLPLGDGYHEVTLATVWPTLIPEAIAQPGNPEPDAVALLPELARYRTDTMP
jgi:hypothetical protein